MGIYFLGAWTVELFFTVLRQLIAVLSDDKTDLKRLFSVLQKLWPVNKQGRLTCMGR